MEKLRLALVADGAPEDWHTNSGVALGMLQALREHPAIESVVPIDASFRGLSKCLIALRTLSFSESEWRARYSQGQFAVRMRSRLVRQSVERHLNNIDLVLLIRGLYEPLPFPYAIFIDSTVALMQAHWPVSAPSEDHQGSGTREDKAQLEAAVHVFTAGTHVAEHLVNDYALSRDRVTPVGGGLNYPLVAIPERAPSPEPTILFVGHDFERKGGDLLVDAFSRVRHAIPDARLLLVGRGAHMAANRPGVSVLGAVDDRHELSELYRSATVFCLPARYEPFGLVLLEAMAHGLPCVASDVGDIPQILEHGRSGVLVAPGDVASLAEALIALLRDQDLQEVLSKRGRRKIEASGTWDLVASRLVEKLRAVPPVTDRESFRRQAPGMRTRTRQG